MVQMWDICNLAICIGMYLMSDQDDKIKLNYHGMRYHVNYRLTLVAMSVLSILS